MVVMSALEVLHTHRQSNRRKDLWMLEHSNCIIYYDYETVVALAVII